MGEAVSAEQARAAGVSYTQLTRAVALGKLRRLARGIYVSAGATWGEELAAISASVCGVASFRAAARLYGLWGFDDAAWEITVERLRRVRRGLRVHHAPLDDQDVTTTGGSPATTLVRTLIDLGTALDGLELQAALESAWIRQPTLLHDLEERLRDRRWAGARKLRAWIEDARGRGRPLESVLEIRLWRAILSWDVPRPIPGVEFRDGEPDPFRFDFFFPNERLAIETDGHRYHRDLDRFIADCNKQSRAAALGIRVMRLSWKCLDDLELIHSRLLRALGLDARKETVRFGDKARWPSEAPGASWGAPLVSAPHGGPGQGSGSSFATRL